MTIDDLKAAVDQAETTLRMTDLIADKMAKLLIGRLRKVTSYRVLKRLKAELQQYDATRDRWKS